MSDENAEGDNEMVAELQQAGALLCEVHALVSGALALVAARPQTEADANSVAAESVARVALEKIEGAQLAVFNARTFAK